MSDSDIQEALAAIEPYHLLGHPDMTVKFDPEHCAVCAGLLATIRPDTGDPRNGSPGNAAQA